MPGGIFQAYSPPAGGPMPPQPVMPPAMPTMPPGSPMPNSQQLPTMPPQIPKESNDPCFDDNKKFCSEKTNLVQREVCLDSNYNKLSNKCRERFTKIRDGFKVCESDIKKFCAKTSFSGGEMHKCLNSNGQKLSQNCQNHVGYRPK